MKPLKKTRKPVKRPYPPPRRQDDKFLKAAFEEWFPALLRFFYPDADQIFDFEREIEFLDKELRKIIPERERSKGDREADLLAKVFLKDGTERWIICNVEIEAGGSPAFPFRLFQYWYRCIDKFNREAMSIAVYTGDEFQSHPSVYQRRLLDTEVSFKFRGFHIFERSDEELLEMGNPFALVVLAAKKAAAYDYLTDKQLNRTRVLILQALRQSGNYSIQQIENFAHFLTHFIYIQDKKENRIFDEALQQVTSGGLTMGIVETVKAIAREEGKLEGKLEGKAEVVGNLLATGKFTIAEIANFSSMTEDFVKQVQADLARNKK